MTHGNSHGSLGIPMQMGMTHFVGTVTGNGTDISEMGRNGNDVIVPENYRLRCRRILD